MDESVMNLFESDSYQPGFQLQTPYPPSNATKKCKLFRCVNASQYAVLIEPFILSECIFH